MVNKDLMNVEKLNLSPKNNKIEAVAQRSGQVNSRMAEEYLVFL